MATDDDNAKTKYGYDDVGADDEPRATRLRGLAAPRRAKRAPKEPALPNISDSKALDLIEAAMEIEKMDAREAGEVGYMPRILVQTNLPYRDPKTKVYTRHNGDLTLSLLSPNGVPFGSIPRFLVSYLATEAKRTGDKVISLGHSQNEFVRLLGMHTAGGAQKDRMKQQCRRFFTTMMTMEAAKTDEKGRTLEAMENILVAKRAFIFWQPKTPDQSSLWESTMELTDDFYKECVTRPVPVDLRVLDALSSSPMAMDVYVWLTYRVVKARNATTLPWEMLMMQFGSADGTEVRTFRRHFLRALKQVLEVSRWQPAISLDNKEGMTIYPGKGHVLPVKKQ
jgi:hypothetical protein